MSFELSPELDSNKSFLVKCSELEGRFDPHFYKPFFQNNEQRVEAVRHAKLNDLVKFSGETWDQEDYFSKTFPYIEIGEIDLLTGNISRISHVDIENAPSRAKMIVRKGDILVSTTRPSRGAISLFDNDELCVASTGFSIIREFKTANISTRFLFYWLRQFSSLWQMEQRSSGGNYPAITQEELGKIKIPVPPKETQTQIIAKMDAAHTAKKQKEAEAQHLLDSIDDYLLDELGIELPEQEENTLQSRMFTRRLNEVSGGRFDAPVHKKKYILESKKFPMKKFSDCVLINPLTSFYGHSSLTEATFIPMEKVSDQYGEADISEYRKIDESGGYKKFQDNDLIWAKITPCMQNGKSAVVTDLQNGIGFGSTEFHVFRAKSKTEISYIHGLLRLSSLRKHAVLYFSGSAGHQRVADDFFKRLSIPLPPTDKQIEIANYITNIRNQAKALQQQAKADLEQVKKEVEAMILSEDENMA